jgi:hypothetical protein
VDKLTSRVRRQVPASSLLSIHIPVKPYYCKILEKKNELEGRIWQWWAVEAQTLENSRAYVPAARTPQQATHTFGLQDYCISWFSSGAASLSIPPPVTSTTRQGIRGEVMKMRRLMSTQEAARKRGNNSAGHQRRSNEIDGDSMSTQEAARKRGNNSAGHQMRSDENGDS